MARDPSDLSISLPADAGSAWAEVEVDVARNLVRYTLAGFFDIADAAAFEEKRERAMAALRCGPNQHLTVLDISGCKIQSQQVIAQFERMLRDPRSMARAIAIVVGSSLARMQVRRMMSRDTLAYFATVADAEKWLLAQPAGARQPLPTASATEPNPSRARQAASSPSSRAGSPGPP